MSNNDNEKILGWIILAGLFVFILIAILQFLTVIFLFLTIFSILATILFLILGFTNNDSWNEEPYFLYSGIAFLCIFAFFFLGQATYSVSEALQNNEMTKGLMQITGAFFFIQEQKQNAIDQIEDAQIQVLNNITNEINNIK